MWILLWDLFSSYLSEAALRKNYPRISPAKFSKNHTTEIPSHFCRLTLGARLRGRLTTHASKKGSHEGSGEGFPENVMGFKARKGYQKKDCQKSENPRIRLGCGVPFHRLLESCFLLILTEKIKAARLQNEIAPEKLLNRYEKRFEKRKKGSEKRSETCLKNC